MVAMLEGFKLFNGPILTPIELRDNVLYGTFPNE